MRVSIVTEVLPISMSEARIIYYARSEPDGRLITASANPQNLKAKLTAWGYEIVEPSKTDVNERK